MEMTLNEYQRRAMTTCMASSDNFCYMFLNLAGEVGEFASKVAKSIRKEQTVVIDNRLYFTSESIDEVADKREALMLEAGDVLWQLAGLCSTMGWSLEDVAQANIDKLSARKKEGTIDGSGDGVTKEERSK